jgi:hypothetical protein
MQSVVLRSLRTLHTAPLVRQLRLTWLRIESHPALASRLLIMSWGITRAVLFAGLLIAHSYCDPQFYNYAGKLAAGQWPYTAAVPVEYPPLAMVLILLPALPLLPFAGIAPRPDPAFSNITHIPIPNPVRYGAYGISFAVEMLIFDAVTLWLVQRAGRRYVPGDRAGLRSGLLYVGLIFLNGALLQKFDMVSGLCCLVALLALIQERTGLAWSMLALATLIKGFPLLAIPIFAGYQVLHSGHADLRQVLRERCKPLLLGLAAFGATIGAWTLLVWIFAGPNGIMHSVLYQGNRGTEIESLYANGVLLLGWIPRLHIYTVFNPQDLSRIVKSSLDSVMDVVSLVVLAVLLVLAYGATFRALQQNRRTGSIVGTSGVQHLQLIGIGVVAISLAFMLSFRALPAHYLLAIIPVAALLRLPSGRLQWTWLAALVGIAVAGQLVTMPIVWHALVMLQPGAVLLLTLRNCAWIAAFGTLFLALWRPVAATHQSRRVRE